MIGPLNLWISFCCLLGVVSGNVEKAIFVAPPSIPLPDEGPSLENLQLEALTPDQPTVRARLNATFPGPESPYGSDSWLLMQGLSANSRYEVRICWVATQPTSFKTHLFSLLEVFEDPTLLQALSYYVETKDSIVAVNTQKDDAIMASDSSAMFLRIQAAADYFTSRKDLMEHVRTVDVEIILDPYFLGLAPRSLLPTVAYLAAVIVLAWYASSRIVQYFHLHPNDFPPTFDQKAR
ncbi:MAG: hypothetical protein M1814_003348 [Vezdaea aestivalis]|nr:MAG: hypothetical protein M1814_003348 [Vezdaea aestivalis]